MKVVSRFLCKKGRVRSKPNHPGHGPQTTLTSKLKGKTTARNLPTVAVVKLVEEQIKNHGRFTDWRNRWIVLNEQASDLKPEETLKGERAPQESLEKKRRGRSKWEIEHLVVNTLCPDAEKGAPLEAPFMSQAPS
jgi:hypothetical protein